MSKETEVKDRILEVSRKLFVENGYNGTSIRDIAKAADVNVAMVNYYFRTKHDLFEIVFDESANILLNKIFSVVQSDLPFYELLDSWVSSYYEMLKKYPQIPIFVLNEVHQHPEHLWELISKRNPPQVIEKLKGRVQQEIEKGTMREIPIMNFLLNVLGLCVFPFMMGEILTQVTGERPEEYYVILDNHKNYVIEFITRAIQP
jgi:AcrR family transcriptional regulator